MVHSFPTCKLKGIEVLFNEFWAIKRFVDRLFCRLIKSFSYIKGPDLKSHGAKAFRDYAQLSTKKLQFSTKMSQLGHKRPRELIFGVHCFGNRYFGDKVHLENRFFFSVQYPVIFMCIQAPESSFVKSVARNYLSRLYEAQLLYNGSCSLAPIYK